MSVSLPRPVAVMGFLVVVVLHPIDAYFNKDNKHQGHIREGKIIPVPGIAVSSRESDMIMRCYQALRVALDAIHG